MDSHARFELNDERFRLVEELWAMPDIEIAGIDLAAGIKPKTMCIPSMKADVTLKNPPADLLKAVKKDDLSPQPMLMAAFESLTEGKAEFRRAIMELDAKRTKRPHRQRR